MSTETLSAQEAERVIVFRYADNFPLIPDEGVIAYIIDPSTGTVIAEARDMATALQKIDQGHVAYVVGEVPDENGEELYWTISRLQATFDAARRRYVLGE